MMGDLDLFGVANAGVFRSPAAQSGGTQRAQQSAQHASSVASRLSRAPRFASKLKTAGAKLQQLAARTQQSTKTPSHVAAVRPIATAPSAVHAAISHAVAARTANPRVAVSRLSSNVRKAVSASKAAAKSTTHIGDMQAAINQIVTNVNAYAAALDQLSQAGDMLAQLQATPTQDATAQQLEQQLQAVADAFPTDPGNSADVAAATQAVASVPSLLSQANAWLQQGAQPQVPQPQAPSTPQSAPSDAGTPPTADSGATLPDAGAADAGAPPTGDAAPADGGDDGGYQDDGSGGGGLDAYAVEDLQTGAADAVAALTGDDSTGDDGSGGDGSGDDSADDGDESDGSGDLDLMGVDVIGGYDLGTARKQMDSLKNVPVGVARIFVERGLKAIGTAKEIAKQPWYRADLPGATTRDEVQGHLQWHMNNLAKFNDTSAVYPDGVDLKEWVLRAYIEQNAAETGADTQVAAKAWDDYVDMWKAAGEFIASLPPAALEVLKKEAAAVRSVVSGAAGGLVESLTGLPVWAWALIALGIVGVTGLVAWGILNSKAGAAAAGVVVKRYVG